MEEFVLHEKMRGESYKFLAACFYSPQKDLFLGEGLLANLRRALSLAFPPAADPAERMEEAFRRSTPEELTLEHARLFLGPYKLQAPPYGSIYLEEKKMVMGDSTLEVLEAYRQAGLAIDPDFKEMPDHVAVELEFMYFLAFQEVAALEKHDWGPALKFFKAQEDFWNRFPARWIPPFCGRIKTATSNDFYSALAECLSLLATPPHLPELPPEVLKGAPPASEASPAGPGPR